MLKNIKLQFAKNIIIYSLPIGYFYGCYNLGYYSEKLKYNLYNINGRTKS